MASTLQAISIILKNPLEKVTKSHAQVIFGENIEMYRTEHYMYQKFDFFIDTK